MPGAATAHALSASFLGSGAGRSCSAEGDMLWSKTDQGDDQYDLCYAPSLQRGNSGPSASWIRCDVGTYFTAETPRFCCKNPRVEINGKRMAHGEVCGDLLSEFDPDNQKLRITEGPSSTGTPEQLADLNANGLGDSSPSPISMNAMKEKGQWKNVNGAKCSGKLGQMIAWTRGEPPGRAELCMPGSKPVHGSGSSSWSCDGYSLKPSELYCCKVRGNLKCVPHFVEYAGNPAGPCKCPGIGGPKRTNDSPQPQQPTEASISTALLLALRGRCQLQGVGRRKSGRGLHSGRLHPGRRFL